MALLTARLARLASIVNSLISLFYYVRIVRYMYSEDHHDQSRLKLGLGTSLALGLGVVLIVLLGVWPDLVWEPAIEAARSLVGPAAAP